MSDEQQKPVEEEPKEEPDKTEELTAQINDLKSQLGKMSSERGKYQKLSTDQTAELEKIRASLKAVMGEDVGDVEAQIKSLNEKLNSVSQLQTELQEERLNGMFIDIADRLDADRELTKAYLKANGLFVEEKLQENIVAAIKTYPKLKNEKPVRKVGADTSKPGKSPTDMNQMIRRAAGH